MGLWIAVWLGVTSVWADGPEKNRYFVETFGKHYVARPYLEEFSKLTPQERVLAYYFEKFARATRDLTFLQAHPRGLEARVLLENVVLAYQTLRGKPGYSRRTETALTDFLKTYYLWHGPYVWGGKAKITLDLAEDDVFRAIRLIEEQTGSVTMKEWLVFHALFTDPNSQPYFVSPEGQLGTQTFYQNLTLDEAREFRKKKYPHNFVPPNSILQKRADGRIVERFIRTGGVNCLLPYPNPKQAEFDALQSEISKLEPTLAMLAPEAKPALEERLRQLTTQRDRNYFDWANGMVEDYIAGRDVFPRAEVPKGDHANELHAGMPFLQAAINSLPMGYDRAGLEFLRRSLESGGDNPIYRYAYAIAADKSTGRVRCYAGFAEDLYADPLSHTGHWQVWNFITKDHAIAAALTTPEMMLKLQSAIPWSRDLDNPSPRASTTFIDWMFGVGSLAPAHAGGFNTTLDPFAPFATSLSTVAQNWLTARSQGAPPGAAEEFFLHEADRKILRERLDTLSENSIILHESLGHAIGKRKNGYDLVIKDGSMFEEARAETAAIFLMGDPTVRAITGITDEELRVFYLEFVTDNVFAGLAAVPEGDTEHRRPHQRAFGLTSHYLLAGNYGVRAIDAKGQPWKSGEQVYFEVTDVAKLREGLGKLLYELMEIIGRADSKAADALNAKYGPPPHAEWLPQARARARKIDRKTQWVALLPELRPIRQWGHVISDAEILEPRDFLSQQLALSGHGDCPAKLVEEAR